MIYYDLTGGVEVALGFYENTPIDVELSKKLDKVDIKVKLGFREYAISVDWSKESEPSFRITYENTKAVCYANYENGDLHTNFQKTLFDTDNESDYHSFKFGKIVAVVSISMEIYQIAFYDSSMVKM